MLKEGDKAPSFSLLDDSDNTIKLEDLKGKWVILYFYPKDMTPGCTQEACDFRDRAPIWKKKKAVVLGISRDDIEKHKKFKEKHELNFPLLSDELGEVCKLYEVWQEKSLYGRKFMGIVRTTFLIDPSQKIRKIFHKVKVRGHADAVLEEIS